MHIFALASARDEPYVHAMEQTRHQAPRVTATGGSRSTRSVGTGAQRNGRTRGTRYRHRSIASGDELTAADTAVALDAPAIAELAARHPGVDIEPMRNGVEPTVHGALCHHQPSIAPMIPTSTAMYEITIQPSGERWFMPPSSWIQPPRAGTRAERRRGSRKTRDARAED